MKQTIIKSEEITIHPNCDRTVSIIPPPGLKRLSRLVVDDLLAARFIITGIALGRRNQMMSPGAVPAELFTRTFGGDYNFDLLPPDTEVRISATNISAELSPFEIAILGDDDIAEAPPKRRNFIGFGNTTVAPKSQARICVQPGYAFRAERPIIPSTIAENFTVSNILVGKQEQLRTSSPIPADLFSEKVLGGLGLGFDVCAPSVFLTIVVNNVSTEAQNFRCAFIGTFLVG